MSQTYLCKNLGVEEGGGCLFKGGSLAGDYGTTAHGDVFERVIGSIVPQQVAATLEFVMQFVRSFYDTR